jgi:hypothetical protein
VSRMMTTPMIYKEGVPTAQLELQYSNSGTPNPPTPTLLSPSQSLWSRMRNILLPVILSVVLSYILLLLSGHATPATGPELTLTVSTVPEFSAFEYPIALSGLYANIGPNGCKSSGAAAGVVIASPSTCKFVVLSAYHDM